MQLEADTMRVITGKPELGNAKRSWVMAKEAHEEALERAQQNATPIKVVSKDSEKDRGRELKVIDWQKAKESHAQALKRATEQEEMKRKAREEKEAAARTEEIQHLEAFEASAIEFARSKSIANVANDVSGESVRKMKSNINAFSELKASEMSEKEFKKLVKRISSTRSNKM
eukprot:scaffold2063_cov117-Skeletonema_marinoi.AAC.1